MEIGQQIKKYRDQLHLSQEQLGDKIYVTRQTISNWEKRHKYAGHKYFD
jgi:DNA-binding XRE family transcriptional regulator